MPSEDKANKAKHCSLCNKNEFSLNSFDRTIGNDIQTIFEIDIPPNICENRKICWQCSFWICLLKFWKNDTCQQANGPCCYSTLFKGIDKNGTHAAEIRTKYNRYVTRLVQIGKKTDAKRSSKSITAAIKVLEITERSNKPKKSPKKDKFKSSESDKNKTIEKKQSPTNIDHLGRANSTSPKKVILSALPTANDTQTETKKTSSEISDQKHKDHSDKANVRNKQNNSSDLNSIVIESAAKDNKTKKLQSPTSETKLQIISPKNDEKREIHSVDTIIIKQLIDNNNHVETNSKSKPSNNIINSSNSVEHKLQLSQMVSTVSETVAVSGAIDKEPPEINGQDDFDKSFVKTQLPLSSIDVKSIDAKKSANALHTGVNKRPIVNIPTNTRKSVVELQKSAAVVKTQISTPTKKQFECSFEQALLRAQTEPSKNSAQCSSQLTNDTSLLLLTPTTRQIEIPATAKYDPKMFRAYVKLGKNMVKKRKVVGANRGKMDDRVKKIKRKACEVVSDDVCSPRTKKRKTMASDVANDEIFTLNNTKKPKPFESDLVHKERCKLRIKKTKPIESGEANTEDSALHVTNSKANLDDEAKEDGYVVSVHLAKAASPTDVVNDGGITLRFRKPKPNESDKINEEIHSPFTKKTKTNASNEKCMIHIEKPLQIVSDVATDVKSTLPLKKPRMIASGKNKEDAFSTQTKKSKSTANDVETDERCIIRIKKPKTVEKVAAKDEKSRLPLKKLKTTESDKNNEIMCSPQVKKSKGNASVVDSDERCIIQIEKPTPAQLDVVSVHKSPLHVKKPKTIKNDKSTEEACLPHVKKFKANAKDLANEEVSTPRIKKLKSKAIDAAISKNANEFTPKSILQPPNRKIMTNSGSKKTVTFSGSTLFLEMANSSQIVNENSLSKESVTNNCTEIFDLHAKNNKSEIGTNTVPLDAFVEVDLRQILATHESTDTIAIQHNADVAVQDNSDTRLADVTIVVDEDPLDFTVEITDNETEALNTVNIQGTEIAEIISAPITTTESEKQSEVVTADNGKSTDYNNDASSAENSVGPSNSSPLKSNILSRPKRIRKKKNRDIFDERINALPKPNRTGKKKEFKFKQKRKPYQRKELMHFRMKPSKKYSLAHLRKQYGDYMFNSYVKLIRNLDINKCLDGNGSVRIKFETIFDNVTNVTKPLSVMEPSQHIRREIITSHNSLSIMHMERNININTDHNHIMNHSSESPSGMNIDHNINHANGSPLGTIELYSMPGIGFESPTATIDSTTSGYSSATTTSTVYTLDMIPTPPSNPNTSPMEPMHECLPNDIQSNFDDENVMFFAESMANVVEIATTPLEQINQDDIISVLGKTNDTTDLNMDGINIPSLHETPSPPDSYIDKRIYYYMDDPHINGYNGHMTIGGVRTKASLKQLDSPLLSIDSSGYNYNHSLSSTQALQNELTTKLLRNDNPLLNHHNSIDENGMEIGGEEVVATNITFTSPSSSISTQTDTQSTPKRNHMLNITFSTPSKRNADLSSEDLMIEDLFMNESEQNLLNGNFSNDAPATNDIVKLPQLDLYHGLDY